MSAREALTAAVARRLHDKPWGDATERAEEAVAALLKNRSLALEVLGPKPEDIGLERCQTACTHTTWQGNVRIEQGERHYRFPENPEAGREL
jgi:hypothetical protein